jgi:hypothetical protein
MPNGRTERRVGARLFERSAILMFVGPCPGRRADDRFDPRCGSQLHAVTGRISWPSALAVPLALWGPPLGVPLQRPARLEWGVGVHLSEGGTP